MEREDWIAACAYVGAMAVIGFVTIVIFAISCDRRWAGSHLESNWSLFGGCRVKMPDGRWIPDDRVRDIDIAPRK